MKQSTIQTIEDKLNDKVANLVGANLLIMQSGNQYFVKEGVKSDSYTCELNGLKEIHKTGALEVATPILATDTFIVTRYVKPYSPNSSFYKEMGSQLAKMHQHTIDQFGFYEDNFIGATPQLNRANEEEKYNWSKFYYNKRLQYQYNLALKNGLQSTILERGFKMLEGNIAAILGDNREPPTLLHGDLWCGNYLCDKLNRPTLIDPAVYYGDRETDLAMTRLFGGFPSSFYASYNAIYPLRRGWRSRIPIYQLYHVLNHYNLFGEAYLSKAEQLISRYF